MVGGYHLAASYSTRLGSAQKSKVQLPWVQELLTTLDRTELASAEGRCQRARYQVRQALNLLQCTEETLLAEANWVGSRSDSLVVRIVCVSCSAPF